MWPPLQNFRHFQADGVLARDEKDDRPQGKAEGKDLKNRSQGLPSREPIEERSEGLLIVERYLTSLEHGGCSSEGRSGVGDREDGAELKRNHALG